MALPASFLSSLGSFLQDSAKKKATESGDILGAMAKSSAGAVPDSIGSIFSIILIGSIIYVLINNDRKVSWGEAFGYGFKKFFVVLGTSILVGFAILGSFLLFIIPGIWVGFMLSLSTYIAVSENVGPVEAMRRSWIYMEKNIGNYWWKQFIFTLVLILIMLAGLFLSGSVSRVTPYLSLIIESILIAFISALSLVFQYNVFGKIRDAKKNGQEFEKNNLVAVMIAFVVIFISIVVFLGVAIFQELSGVQNKIKETKIIASMLQLNTQAMLFYANKSKDPSYSGFSCSSNGTTKQICNEIKSYGRAPEIVIPNDGSSYCIEAKLNMTQYYCVDSSGVSGKVSSPNVCAETNFCGAAIPISAPGF